MSDEDEKPNARQWLDSLPDHQKQAIAKLYMRALEHAQEPDTEAKIERAFTRAYDRAIELGMEEEQKQPQGIENLTPADRAKAKQVLLKIAELAPPEDQPPLKTLEQYRHEKGMSVMAFCAWMSIAPISYYKARRGEKIAPWTIKKIAHRLKVKPHQIAEFANPKE